MRTIKAGDDLETLVKVGDIVRLEGFTDDPVIAIAARRSGALDCSGCVLDVAHSCSATMRDHTGAPYNVSICCIRPSWMMQKGERHRFVKFIKLDSVLENL